MSEPYTHRDPVEELAEEFLARYRRGERPALTEYTGKFPELAEEIRDLFPALVMMEEAGPKEPISHAKDRDRITADGHRLQFVGDYRILREVGRGGMGVVYEAEQQSLGRHVALKVLPFASSKDLTCLKRFRREARAAARLHHTNIVPVHDVGVHEGVHYYAMQFIQGQGLDEVLLELRKLRAEKLLGGPPPEVRPRANLTVNLAGNMLTGRFAVGEPEPNGADPFASVLAENAGNADPLQLPLPVPEAGSAKLSGASDTFKSGALDASEFSTQSDFRYYRSVARVGLQVAEALAYAHAQKVLHRDIKPSNLLLDVGGIVWVTDFGLAKEEGDDVTRTGDVVGTLRYMAPERFSGVSDARSDIYSLGLTLYELITLRPAFEESDRGRLICRIGRDEPLPPRRFDRRTPRDLETIVLKAMAKEPAGRYQTAEELCEDLRRFLADRPIQARRASWREQAWRWCRRNPGWAATIATVFGLLLLIAAGSAIFSFHLQQALKDVQSADDEKTEKLWLAHLERARALRSSGRVGQRFQALKSIREAARIRITPELRDEAVAALVLPDVEVVREWDGQPKDTTEWTCDAHFQRCAWINTGGEITVSRLTDASEEVIFRLPKQDGDGNVSWGLWMSPDGRFLVHAHSSPRQSVAGKVRIWKLDGPTPSIHFNEPEGMQMFAVAFDADCRRLALGHADGTVSIYDLEKGRRTQQLVLGEGPNAIAFNPRGDRLAVTCRGGVRLFNVETARELQPALRDAKVSHWLYALAWHPEGRVLAACSLDFKIHLWDTETAALVMPPLAGPGVYMTFNPQGDRLISAGWDGMVKLWDAITGRLLLTIPGRFESSGEAAQVQLGHDGLLLGVGRSGTKLRLSRLVYGRELRTIRRAGAEETILSPVLDADGRILAAASNHGLGFFDLESGKQLGFVGFENDDIAVPRRFERSSGWLTGGGRAGMLWPAQWDAARSTLHIGPPKVLASASNVAVDASLDGRIRAFPQKTRTRVMARDRPGWHVDLGPQYDVRGCAVSPDGRWIATCTWHQDPNALAPCVRLWEIEGDRGRHVTDLPVEAEASASFSPNGRWLATSAFAGRQVQVWEVGTWREVRRFKSGACWSSDGQLLATHDRMGEILFVDPEIGKEVLRLIGPEASFYHAASMTPDGTRVIATAGDGSSGLQVWDLRLIRRQLRELGMDWDLPELSEATSQEKPPPTVVLDPGRFRQPMFGSDARDLAVYSLLLELQPINPPAYYQRAMAHSRLSDYQRCIADCEAFLALVPGDDVRRPEIQRHYAEAKDLLGIEAPSRP